MGVSVSLVGMVSVLVEILLYATVLFLVTWVAACVYVRVGV